VVTGRLVRVMWLRLNRDQRDADAQLASNPARLVTTSLKNLFVRRLQ